MNRRCDGRFHDSGTREDFELRGVENAQLFAKGSVDWKRHINRFDWFLSYWMDLWR